MVLVNRKNKNQQYYNSMIFMIKKWRDKGVSEEDICKEIDEWIQDTIEIARAVNEEILYRETNDILYIYECVRLPNNEKDEYVNIYYTPYKIEFTKK